MSTYLLAGGGTAGHVNPLLATADRLREREPDAVVLALGTAEGLESRLVPARGYELLEVPRLPFPRRPNTAALRFPAALRRSVAELEATMVERGVDLVVGFGGYAAAPAYLAARRARLPVVIHEQNAKPGLANRLGARFTPWVGVTFPATRLPHARTVGLPLRREIEQLDLPAARAEGLELFGLAADRPTLLVTGGSTGAKRINESIRAAVDGVLGAGWQLLHLTGTRSPVDDPGLEGYRILEYCDRMELALAVADFAVSRSGAGTLVELAALGVPALYVPYAVGNGEQRLNTTELVAAGGGLVVDDALFSPEWVYEELVPLLGDRARIAALAAGASAWGSRDGADRTVDLILEARAAQPAPMRPGEN